VITSHEKVAIGINERAFLSINVPKTASRKEFSCYHCIGKAQDRQWEKWDRKKEKTTNK
jgi:hypothetical protein